MTAEAGIQNRLELTNPISMQGPRKPPKIGDMVLFGTLGTEAIDVIILSVVRGQRERARITAVDYAPAVYEDTVVTAEFDERAASRAFLSAVEIREVISDETALQFVGGSVQEAISISVEPLTSILPGHFLEVQVQRSDARGVWREPQIFSRTDCCVVIGGVRTGERVDLRLRWNSAGTLPGPWTTRPGELVVGRSTAPSPLQGLTLSSLGGIAYLQWDAPELLDVVNGGSVNVYHDVSLNPSFQNSRFRRRVSASSQLAVTPLVPGTYYLEVVDSFGQKSTPMEIASEATSLFDLSTVGQPIEEGPVFAGNKNGVFVQSGNLKLSSGLSFDSALGLFDSFPGRFDSAGTQNTEGIYEFDGPVDLGSKRKVKVTAFVEFNPVVTAERFDSAVGRFDSRAGLFDGAVPAPGAANVRIFMYATDDAPGGSPTYREPIDLDSVEIEARGLKFEAKLEVTTPSVNVNVSRLGVLIEGVT